MKHSVDDVIHVLEIFQFQTFRCNNQGNPVLILFFPWESLFNAIQKLEHLVSIKQFFVSFLRYFLEAKNIQTNSS